MPARYQEIRSECIFISWFMTSPRSSRRWEVWRSWSEHWKSHSVSMLCGPISVLVIRPSYLLQIISHAKNHVFEFCRSPGASQMITHECKEEKNALKESTVPAKTESVVLLPSRTGRSVIVAMTFAQSAILHKGGSSLVSATSRNRVSSPTCFPMLVRPRASRCLWTALTIQFILGSRRICGTKST